MFEAVEISREITGSGQNLLLCGDVYQQQPALSALAGQVQAVYIDPPFMTGETFTRRRRFGTSGWKTGRPMPEYPAYIDRFADTKEYKRNPIGQNIDVNDVLLRELRKILGESNVIFNE